jgi:hypothetical protein
MKKGMPLIYASQTDYVKRFHIDYRLPAGEAPGSIGAFAGMINYIGGISSGEMREIWQEALGYIRGTCHIISETGVSSNIDDKPRWVSKDEQVLLYVFLPPLMDRTFFFYYNFVGGLGTAFTSWQDSRSPTTKRAFQRVYNTFPEQFQKTTHFTTLGPAKTSWGIKNPDFFASPDSKLGDFFRKSSPTAHDPRSREEQLGELLEQWVARGDTDRNDPITDPAWYTHGSYDTLHNPYSVIEAFRNPKYDLLLRVIFEEFQRGNRLVCMRHGIPVRHALAAKFNVANEENRVAAAAEKARRAAEAARAPCGSSSSWLWSRSWIRAWPWGCWGDQRR